MGDRCNVIVNIPVCKTVILYTSNFISYSNSWCKINELNGAMLRGFEDVTISA